MGDRWSMWTNDVRFTLFHGRLKPVERMVNVGQCSGLFFWNLVGIHLEGSPLRFLIFANPVTPMAFSHLQSNMS